MRRLAAALLAGCVGIAVCLQGVVPARSAQAPDAPPFLKLSQVHAGMTGYGLTVVHGTTIQRFTVRILGILTGGPSSDLILFRAGGPVVQGAGGTASGMSGSPIYVDGRVVGALSYGYHFAGPDADLSLATPIEDMLKALLPSGATAEAPYPRVYRAAAPIPSPEGSIDRVLIMDSAQDAVAYNAHPLPGMLAVAPVAVPLVTSGMTPAAMTILSRTLRRYNVVPLQGYGGRKEFPAPPIQPGSSLGVELVRGDVEVGAIGTVTYRRGDQILAFGHPMLGAGRVSMLLTSAWIDPVVRSLDFPFKEGSIGSLVGTLTQDRGVGVAGVVGRFPRTFGVRVRVRDEDRGTTKTLGVQVVRRPDLAEGLVPMAALALVQKALDRVAGGSAQVRITLLARGLPRAIEREDLAYDIGDIATASVLDVPEATQLLFGNFFRSLDPVDMSIDITVHSQPDTALLVEAHPSVRTVSRGDRVTVRVAVQPYGETERLSHDVEFTVPKDFPVGPAFLLVGTAGSLNSATPLPPDQEFQQLVQQEGTPLGTSSLKEAIDQFERQGKNTEVDVELVPEAVLTAVGSNANPGFESPAGVSIPAEWVVLGRFQIPMTVK
jgi:hypothetical protein